MSSNVISFVPQLKCCAYIAYICFKMRQPYSPIFYVNNFTSAVFFFFIEGFLAKREPDSMVKI